MTDAQIAAVARTAVTPAQRLVVALVAVHAARAAAVRKLTLEQVRGDRVLHEALAVRADPLHLAVVRHDHSTDLP